MDISIVAGISRFGNLMGWPKRRSFLEIGVFRGAFAQIALMNNEDTTLTGIDPYPLPDAREVREQMWTGLISLGLEKRFELFDSAASVPISSEFCVIHVDGEHTEIAVLNDLRFSSERLRAGGVLVVDDVRHRWFPGVAAAVFRFISDSGFRILADTGQKFYLVRDADLDEAREAFRSTFGETLGIFDSWFDRAESARILQKPDVSGRPVLMVEPKQTDEDPKLSVPREGSAWRQLNEVFRSKSNRFSCWPGSK